MTNASWQIMDTAPRDGSKVHIKMELSEGVYSDSFIVPDCWYENGFWVHEHRGGIAKLQSQWMSGWISGAASPDGDDVYIDWREFQDATLN